MDCREGAVIDPPENGQEGTGSVPPQTEVEGPATVSVPPEAAQDATTVGVLPSKEERASFLIEVVGEERAAGLTEVVEAYRVAYGTPWVSEDNKKSAVKKYLDIKRGFEVRNGVILDSHLTRNFQRSRLWGAVLTESSPSTFLAALLHPIQTARDRGIPRRKVLRTGPDTVDDNIHIVELLLKCDALIERARSNLRPRESDKFVSLVFGIVKVLMSLADYTEDRSRGRHRQGDESSTVKSLAILESRLDNASEEYESRLQRGLRTTYLFSMLSGLVALVPLAILAYILLRGPLGSLGTIGRTDVGLGSACLIAGAFGALISVLIRMTSGKFTLPTTAGSREIWVLGAFRTLIGAIFGLSFYVLVVGGLLPVNVPEDPVAVLFFYPGLAFLAGFSERLAQDTVRRTGEEATQALNVKSSETAQGAKQGEGNG
jgi:hypothetical protein